MDSEKWLSLAQVVGTQVLILYIIHKVYLLAARWLTMKHERDMTAPQQQSMLYGPTPLRLTCLASAVEDPTTPRQEGSTT